MRTNNSNTQLNSFLNRIIHGECVDIMRQMPEQSVDFILTDPPYLVNFRDRTGRTLQNDSNDVWLKPAFAEAYRVLKQNSFMVCFYGWSRVEKFVEACFEPSAREDHFDGHPRSPCCALSKDRSLSR